MTTTEAMTTTVAMTTTADADPCAYGGEIKSIEAVDDMTVKFSLCYPDPAFPAKAADTALRSGRRGPDGWQAPRPAGEARRHRPVHAQGMAQGDHLILEANPNYWGDKPTIETMIIRWSPESRTASCSSSNPAMRTASPWSG